MNRQDIEIKLSEAKNALASFDASIEKIRATLGVKKSSLEIAEDPSEALVLNPTPVTVDACVMVGSVEGKVVQLYKRTVSKKINDQKIVLAGTPENPALLVQDMEGKSYFVLSSEVKLVIK